MIHAITIGLDVVLLAVFGFPVLYLAALTLFSFFQRRKMLGSFPSRSVRRFAIMVPAHNEEDAIGRTLQSLQSLAYPRDRHEIFVIADNCTDNTAQAAAPYRVTVLERRDKERRGKGYALRWCLDRLASREPSFDAVVIIDADSVMAHDFLAVMNHYLDQGSRAIQCSDLVEPQPGSWSSEITRLGFTLYNFVRPLGRKLLNCSAGVRGNGMCFTMELLREIPWNTYSLNEDLEYGLVLLLSGINVDFAPEAVVYATMPTNEKNAESQRARWEKGRSPVIKAYGKKLLSHAVMRMSFRAFDAFVELVTPPFVTLFAVVAVSFLVNAILAAYGVEGFAAMALLWFAAVLLGLFHVIGGLQAARADKNLYRAFFHIPHYAVWKAILYGKLLLRGTTTEWVRTTRDQAVPK
jgi:1,2-diacylglycerol 3-beta-glucosyltransferase